MVWWGPRASDPGAWGTCFGVFLGGQISSVVLPKEALGEDGALKPANSQGHSGRLTGLFHLPQGCPSPQHRLRRS